MNDLCISDLAHIVKGRLRLGDMPPLGGEWEPIQRVVVCHEVEATAPEPPRHHPNYRLNADRRTMWPPLSSINGHPVQPGDVVMLCGDETAESLGQSVTHGCAENAYLQGALGVVVAGRRIEPWAGKFSLTVKHVRSAIRCLAAWSRRRFTGMLAMVVESDTQCTLGRAIDQHLRGKGRVQGIWTHASCWLDVATTLLDLSSRDRYAVISVTDALGGAIAVCADLCCPHIGVLATSAADATTIPEAQQALVAALPDDGCVVTSMRLPSAPIANHPIRWVDTTPAELVSTVSSLMSGWGGQVNDPLERQAASGEWNLFADLAEARSPFDKHSLSLRRKK